MSKLETTLAEMTKSNHFSFFPPPTSPTSLQPQQSKSTKYRRSSASNRAQRAGKSSSVSPLDGDEKKNRRSTMSSTQANNGVEAGSTEVTAVVLHGPKDVRIEKKVVPAPADNEVRIKIACTTLCGSDLHYYTHFRNGSIQAKHPFVLGHESCGYITALGSKVNEPASGGSRSTNDQLAIGDLVAIEPGLPCTTCALCLSGRYNLCQSLRFRSSAKPPLPHLDGTLVTELNHPASHVFKLQPTMSVELGALIEPLAVAMHAHSRAKLAAGSTILVFGGGAIGLLCAAVGKSRGLKVVIADIVEERVRFATSNGFADKGVVVPSLPPAKDIEGKLQASQDLATQIAEAHLPGGHSKELVGQVDAVFECTGAQSALQSAIYATKPGGKVMLIGMGQGVQTLPIAAAALREVDLMGVFRYAGTYADAVKLAGSGDSSLPDLESLVTHKIRGAENVRDVFEASGNGGCIKAAYYWE